MYIVSLVFFYWKIIKGDWGGVIWILIFVNIIELDVVFIFGEYLLTLGKMK